MGPHRASTGNRRPRPGASPTGGCGATAPGGQLDPARPRRLPHQTPVGAALPATRDLGRAGRRLRARPRRRQRAAAAARGARVVMTTTLTDQVRSRRAHRRVPVIVSPRVRYLARARRDMKKRPRFLEVRAGLNVRSIAKLGDIVCVMALDGDQPLRADLARSAERELRHDQRSLRGSRYPMAVTVTPGTRPATDTPGATQTLRAPMPSQRPERIPGGDRAGDGESEGVRGRGGRKWRRHGDTSLSAGCWPGSYSTGSGYGVGAGSWSPAKAVDSSTTVHSRSSIGVDSVDPTATPRVLGGISPVPPPGRCR